MLADVLKLEHKTVMTTRVLNHTTGKKVTPPDEVHDAQKGGKGARM